MAEHIDTLDQSATPEPKPKPNREILLNMFIVGWPGIFTLLFVFTDWVKTNTLNFLAVFQHQDISNREIDWWTIIFWIVFFSWFPAFRSYESMKRKKHDEAILKSKIYFTGQIEAAKTKLTTENDKLFGQWSEQNKLLQTQLKEAISEINSTIRKAPNVKSFSQAITFFKQVIRLFTKLDLESYKPEYANNNFSHIKELKTALFGVHELSIDLAQNFFIKEGSTFGANFMIFIGNEGAKNQTAIKILLAGAHDKEVKKLYFRDEHKDDLKGVLYLCAELLEPSKKDDENKRSIPILVIPIYNNPNIYKDEKNKDTDGKLPGAICAFYDEKSMVKDTHDMSAFSIFDERTQLDLKTFFSENGDVRSFASFCVQACIKSPPDKAKEEVIGIYNIDSSFVNSFGEDENFFDTFYTMIYPMFRSAAPYLEVYRKYVIEGLVALDS